MSKPELDIIRSPEAETFRQMVTKGFYDRSYIGLWIYEIMGREWDEMRAWAEKLKLEIFVQTCTWSIDIWEWVYGFEPDETMTLEERRQRILNRVHGVRPINPEAVRRGVEELAQTETEVHDLVGPYRFEVILHPQNVPLPYEKILKYLRDIKPSHLSFDFRIVIEAKEPAYLYAGGTSGIHAHIGMAEELNTYEHLDTVHVGGIFEIRSVAGIVEGENHFGALSTIHTGGVFGGLAVLPPEEDTTLPPADSALYTGIGASERTTLFVPEDTAPPPASDTVRAGGTAAPRISLTIPEDTAPPPTLSIQRVGTVCTIISNLSQEE